MTKADGFLVSNCLKCIKRLSQNDVVRGRLPLKDIAVSVSPPLFKGCTIWCLVYTVRWPGLPNRILQCVSLITPCATLITPCAVLLTCAVLFISTMCRHVYKRISWLRYYRPDYKCVSVYTMYRSDHTIFRQGQIPSVTNAVPMAGSAAPTASVNVRSATWANIATWRSATRSVWTAGHVWSLESVNVNRATRGPTAREVSWDGMGWDENMRYTRYNDMRCAWDVMQWKEVKWNVMGWN